VLELRAIWPPAVPEYQPPIIKHFRANGYKSIQEFKVAFENEALRLNGCGYNMYTVINPIKTTFSDRAVTDADISHRELVLVDIDRTSSEKVPANDSEVEAANQLADEVSAYLKQLEWPDPIRVMSGNGHHLYYVLPEFSNSDESKEFTQNLLLNLSDKFDNEIVKIDTSVFNASRITKVVGTIARKGLESEGRPYRMARML
jgi:DNA primase